MKKVSFLLLNAVIAASVLLTSCGSDDTDDDPAPASPNVNVLAASTGTIDGDAEVAPGETFTIGITVTKGDANLESVNVNIGTNPLAAAKIQTGATAAASMTATAWTSLTNDLSGDDKDGFTWYFTITTEATANDGDVQPYSIVVTDKDGESTTTTVTITAKVATTALTETTGHAIFNNAGAGFGGFDFSADDSVSTTGTSGDIMDIGFGGSGTTWVKKISAANGASLVSVNASVYTSASVESLATDFAAGTTITGDSDELSVDDVFIVKDGSNNYFIFKVTAINETASDNLDNIVFSVKS